jgi:hypothetical protein
MSDVTEVWHTFAESEGAEYLADYVAIWHCPACRTVVGSENGSVRWVMESEAPVGED